MMVAKKSYKTASVMRAVTQVKVHGANMGPTWVLSDPDGPHVGPMNLDIRVSKVPLGLNIMFQSVSNLPQTFDNYCRSFYNICSDVHASVAWILLVFTCLYLRYYLPKWCWCWCRLKIPVWPGQKTFVCGIDILRLTIVPSQFTEKQRNSSK